MESVCWRWHLGIISTSGKKSCIPWNEGGLWGNARRIRTMWFIKAFSSQSLFQDWLANGIADLHPHPVTSLLDCTGLARFLPCTSRQWLHLPTYHAGFAATCKGRELGLTLPEWSIVGARNYSHFGFTFSALLFISATEMVWQQTRSFTEQLQSPGSYHWFWKPGLMVNWCF